ncbi:MAG: tetratricopeptide repeat protein [Planctomycetota bacterium]
MRRAGAAGAVLLGLSVAAAITAVGKGNQLILALPVAAWVVLTAWPQARGEAARTGRGGLVLGAMGALAAIGTLAIFAGRLQPGIDEVDVLRALDSAERMAAQGQVVEALRAFEAIAVPEFMPRENARKHHNCAVLLIQLQRPDLAVEHLVLSLRYDPTNAQAAYLLAVLAADKGRTDEAMAMVQMSLSLRPDQAPARRLLAKLLSSRATHRMPP